MPLTVAPSGKDLKIIKVLMDGKLQKHLQSLGVSESSVIELVSISADNVICKVKESRLAIDKMTASKIMVVL